jgi:1-acylglycerone phosphate reductase
MYGSSKAALTNASEAWRLELSPFGVRVVTTVTGRVASRFFENATPYTTPDGSRYGAVESNIREIESAAGPAMPAEQFAEDVVKAVEGGANGLLWKGNNAGLVRLMSHIAPTFVMVGLHIRRRKVECRVC